MPLRTPHKMRVILATTADEEQALSIARMLVSERLAACVNVIGPITSVYRWRDAIEDAREFLLLIKTRATLYMKVESRVRELHSYEVPEVLALTADRGSPPYIQWLLASTGPGRPSAKSSAKKLAKNRRGASR